MKRTNILKILIIAYLLVLLIGPVIKNGISESNTYTYDYYAHVTGANQIKDQGYISFSQDERVIWGDDSGLFYPPGFMVFVAVLSLMTGIDALYLPLLMIFIQWIIFLLLIYLTVRLFISDELYLDIALISGLIFISGSRFLGVNFFVPPILGCFLIWSNILILLNDNIGYIKKTLLIAIFTAIIFITHRPSSVVWGLAVASLLIAWIIYRDRPARNIFFSGFAGTVIAFDAALLILFRRIFIEGNAADFFYNLNPKLPTAPIFFVALVIVNILAASCIFFISKRRIDRFPESAEKHTRPSILLLIVLITFVLFMATASPFLLNFVKNMPALNPTTFSLDIWNTMVHSEYSDIRPIVYIFHIGILAVLLYLPSILLMRHDRRYILVSIIPLIMIASTFFIYDVLDARDQRPERIYLYIAPYLILGSLITIRYAFKNQNKAIIYIIIFLFLANFLIASNVNTLNSQPFLNPDEYNAIKWMEENIKNETVLARGGDTAQPSKAIGLENSTGIFSYNKYTIRDIVQRRGLHDVYLFDDKRNSGTQIRGLDEAIDENPSEYLKIYSSGIQDIYQYRLP